MLVATVGYIIFAVRYQGETFIHGEQKEQGETPVED